MQASLGRVQELLDADPVEFAAQSETPKKPSAPRSVAAKNNRKRISQLAAGDHLALPQIVWTTWTGCAGSA